MTNRSAATGLFAYGLAALAIFWGCASDPAESPTSAGSGGAASSSSASAIGGGASGSAAIGSTSAGSGGAADGGGGAGGGGGQPFVPDPSCDYFDTASGQLVFSCGGAWTVFDEMQSAQGDQLCPRWYDVDGHDFATIDQAVAALSCSTDCVYRATGAALYVYCNQKSEATTFIDGGPGQTSPPGACAPLYYFDTSVGSGFYSSEDAFAQANPCP